MVSGSTSEDVLPDYYYDNYFTQEMFQAPLVKMSFQTCLVLNSAKRGSVSGSTSEDVLPDIYNRVH